MFISASDCLPSASQNEIPHAQWPGTSGYLEQKLLKVQNPCSRLSRCLILGGKELQANTTGPELTDCMLLGLGFILYKYPVLFLTGNFHRLSPLVTGYESLDKGCVTAPTQFSHCRPEEKKERAPLWFAPVKMVWRVVWTLNKDTS